MPELPEVEATRRSFAQAIQGARIEAVVLGKPLRWPLGCDPMSLVGQHVTGLRRRGKYLLADMSRGLLLLHLGMSGSLLFGRELPAAGVHDHFELWTSHGTLRLHDPRRFGAVVFAVALVAFAAQASVALAVAMGVLGVLGVLLLGIYQAALTGIYSAVLYRYAVSHETPPAFRHLQLGQAFAPKA